MTRVSDYIADFIYQQGVRDIFMLTGGGSIYLDDGVACHKNLRAICVGHEATAPMMAEAYARLNRGLGVVYVTTGPGGANAVSGLAEAWVDSAPILIISGQVALKHTSRNTGIKNLRTFGTQELDIIEVVKPLTKYAKMVTDAHSIRYHLEKAVYLAKTARPGPVWLDIPLDIQAAMVDEKSLKGYKGRFNSGSDKDIDSHVKRVFRLLLASKRPLIVGGQGIRIAGAIKEFKALLELSDIPAVFSRLGQDILPFSHRNNFGHGGIKGLPFTAKIMKQSDLVISIGSRLSIPFVGNNCDVFSKDTKVVMVDVDDAELKKPGVKINLPIKSDAKLFIRKLLDRIKTSSLPGYNEWLKVCRDYKEKWVIITPEHKRNPIDLYYFLSRLDALSGSNNVFVSDAGSSYYLTGQVYRFEQGQREITSGAFASMGLTIPLAIGCSVSDNDIQVLGVTGDGSLELNIQELKTMACYKLNIKLFVINNGGYVSIRNTQDQLCEGRHIGSDQAKHNWLLDFQKVALAFGLPYFLIENHEEIDGKILEVMSKKGPAFIEVVCDKNQKIIESFK